jgi:hypothetical protein
MENSPPTQNQKTILIQIALTIVLIFSCGLSTGARIIAPGWFLIIFGIFLVLLPLFIHLVVHAIVVVRAVRAKPGLYFVVFPSHLFLFLCFLTQPDFGDVGGAYTGLSMIFSWVGIKMPLMDEPGVYIPPIVFAVFLFLSWIMVHLPWFYHKRETPQISKP